MIWWWINIIIEDTTEIQIYTNSEGSKKSQTHTSQEQSWFIDKEICRVKIAFILKVHGIETGRRGRGEEEKEKRWEIEEERREGREKQEGERGEGERRQESKRRSGERGKGKENSKEERR